MLPEDTIIQRVYNYVAEYKRATLVDSLPQAAAASRSTPLHSAHRATKWVKPDAGMVKINSDANLQINGAWGLGGIIRDNEGLVMAAGTWLVHGHDHALEAEAFAMLTTMKFTAECGFRSVMFEGDNERLIRMVKEGLIQDRFYPGLMVQEILKTKLAFDKYLFSFIPRTGNKVAHHLAQLAHSDPNMIWMEEVPLAITSMYLHDILN